MSDRINIPGEGGDKMNRLLVASMLLTGVFTSACFVTVPDPYEGIFRCDADNPCAGDFSCGPDGICVPDDPDKGGDATKAREIITAYLQRHALTPLPEGMEAPPAYLSNCSDCHAAPDPGLHSATEWPAVMARMATHRAVMAREPLDPVQATRVLAYLSKHAAPEPGDPFTPGRWLALAPVLALVGFALFRLLRSRRSA